MGEGGERVRLLLGLREAGKMSFPRCQQSWEFLKADTELDSLHEVLGPVDAQG